MTLGAIPALGLVLVLAWLAGHLTPRRVPQIVTYLLVGAALGPSALALVRRSAFEDLRPVTQVAMGVLLFLIGEHLGLEAFRRAPRLLLLPVLSYVVTGTAVFCATLAAGASLTLALVLSAFAGGGAPMTVAAIARQGVGSSEYVESLIGLHAAVDWLTACAFSVMLPLAIAVSGSHQSAAAITGQMVRLGIAGVVVGLLLALSLSRVLPRVSERRRLAVVAAHALTAVGISVGMGLSVPLAALVLGAVTAKATPPSVTMGAFARLAAAEPVLYLFFFTLGGAAIRVNALPELGFVGAAYILARSASKLATGTVGGLLVGMGRSRAVRVGWDSLPQAGVSLGLAAIASAALPGRGIATVTIGSIVIFELVGALVVSESLRRGHARATPIPRGVGA